MKPKTWFAEVRRRKVLRVATVYAIVGWGTVEIAETVAPLLHLPPWTPTLILLVALLGFPVALVLAWAFELSPDGVRRTRAAESSGSSGDGARTAAIFGLGVLLALVAFGIYATLGSPRAGSPAAADAPAAPGERSIAVLPFADMSTDEEHVYLSAGITEDILTRLAQLSELRVISRTSVMRYEGTRLSIPEIARELDVRYVLEGSVQRVGDRVRVTGQLIDAATDAHLWADSYDRDLTDIFAVQSEIADQIVRALEVRLRPAERERLTRLGPRSVMAYELYLQARDYFPEYRPPDSYQEYVRSTLMAAALLRQAIAEDSVFAPAYAALSDVFDEHPGLPPRERYDSAVAYARKAIRLDPGLADGYVQLGFAYKMVGEREAMIEQMRYATELNPSHSEAWHEIGRYLVRQNRCVDAIPALKTAIRLDPADAGVYRDLAHTYAELGLFDEARDWMWRSVERTRLPRWRAHEQLARFASWSGDSTAVAAHLDSLLAAAPDSPGDWLLRVASLEVLLGRHAEALDHLNAYQTTLGPRDPDEPAPLWAAVAATALGRNADAADLLNEAERRAREALGEFPGAVGAGWPHRTLAAVHALRGQRDEAFAALRRATEPAAERWWLYYDLQTAPGLRSLRHDPEFQSILAGLRTELENARARVVDAGV